MTSNNALIPDPDKEDILASKPFDWPFLHLGLRMCGWGDSQLKFYLMGTPIIWWGSTISLGLAVVAFGVYLLRAQRKYQDMDAREWEHMVYVGKIALLGWMFHYVPFLIMGRVTYLHHYVSFVSFRFSLSAPRFMWADFLFATIVVADSLFRRFDVRACVGPFHLFVTTTLAKSQDDQLWGHRWSASP